MVPGNRCGATTALNLHSNQINGFNQQRPCERTIVAAIDLAKAFDMVDHSVLFNGIPMISNAGLPTI